MWDQFSLFFFSEHNMFPPLKFKFKGDGNPDEYYLLYDRS